MENVTIKITKMNSLIGFLDTVGFAIEALDNGGYRVQRKDQLPVFVNTTGNQLYFEIDLGNISDIASQELYFKLLELNTTLLPVGFAICNKNPDDPRLLLVESREKSELSDIELLSVFDALEYAVKQAEILLFQ